MIIEEKFNENGELISRTYFEVEKVLTEENKEISFVGKTKRKPIYKDHPDIDTITDAIGELGDITYEDIKDLETAVAELGDAVAKLYEELGE